MRRTFALERGTVRLTRGISQALSRIGSEPPEDMLRRVIAVTGAAPAARRRGRVLLGFGLPATATLVAIAVGLAVWMNGRDGPYAALAQAVRSLELAETVHVVMPLEGLWPVPPGQDTPKSLELWAAGPARYRQEFHYKHAGQDYTDLTVADGEREWCYHASVNKVDLYEPVITRHLQDLGEAAMDVPRTIGDLTREAEEKKLPLEVVHSRGPDGRSLDTYVLESAPGERFEVTIDPRASRLTAIVAEHKEGDRWVQHVSFDQFDYGQALDEALFTFRVPPGAAVEVYDTWKGKSDLVLATAKAGESTVDVHGVEASPDGSITVLYSIAGADAPPDLSMSDARGTRYVRQPMMGWEPDTVHGGRVFATATFKREGAASTSRPDTISLSVPGGEDGQPVVLSDLPVKAMPVPQP